MNLAALQPDLLVLNGDVIYQLDSWQDNVCRNVYEHPYDIVKDLLDQYFPDTPRMYVLGNHEFPQNNDDPALTQSALEVWLKKTGQPVRDHQVINGVHFIKYPLLTWAMPVMPEQEAWAMTELQSALEADSVHPVFFVSHDSTGDPTYLWPEPESFSAEFRAFLRKHPRIVHISGHRHMHIADHQRIYQDGEDQRSDGRTQGIEKTFVDQHSFELLIAHAYRLQHRKFPSAGQDACHDGIDEIENTDQSDNGTKQTAQQ